MFGRRLRRPCVPRAAVLSWGVTMETAEPKLCIATFVARPKRRLVYLPSAKASDYFSFCAEKGCSWETLLGGVEAAFDTPAILRFAPGTGVPACAAGVEVPLAFSAVPTGYEIRLLEPCEMLYFQSEPFDRPELFGSAIMEVQRAWSRFDPRPYGYAYAPELAPEFNFGASPERGARLAVPVRRLSG